MFVIKLKLKTAQGLRTFYAREGLEYCAEKAGAKTFDTKEEADTVAALLIREHIGVGSVLIEIL